MAAELSITAFYKFISIPADELAIVQQNIKNFGKEQSMVGLVLIASEGINGTVAGSAEAIASFKDTIQKSFGTIEWKDSSATGLVFKRWSVKIKEEIVAIKSEGTNPVGKHNHVPPEVFHEMLDQDDVVVLDTRNVYETDVGTFKNAIDPRLSKFSEFPEFVASGAIPKDKKVLMFCTGGIRCEKALLEMEKQGYNEVYQLDGGILNYLEKFPNQKFEGECFVFDHRVALNQELKPSTKYVLSKEHGNPVEIA